MILDTAEVLTASELAELEQAAIDAELDYLAPFVAAEMEDERRAHLAFHFPVSHGPNASAASAQYEHEERCHEFGY